MVKALIKPNFYYVMKHIRKKWEVWLLKNSTDKKGIVHCLKTLTIQIQHLHCATMGKLKLSLLYHDMCWNFNTKLRWARIQPCRTGYVEPYNSVWPVNHEITDDSRRPCYNMPKCDSSVICFDSRVVVNFVLHGGTERRIHSHLLIWIYQFVNSLCFTLL